MLVKIGTPEILISAARDELVANNGQLEMQGVAKRAGLSVGVAYHHFGSKAGLIAAVVEAFYRPMTAPNFGVSRSKNMSWSVRERSRTAAFIDYYFDTPFARLIVGPLGRTPEVLDVEASFRREQLQEGARNLRAAQRSCEISKKLDPNIAIALIQGGLQLAISEALNAQKRPKRSELLDQIWMFIASAVGSTELNRTDKKMGLQNEV